MGKTPCSLKPALSASWALSSSGAPPQAEKEPFSVDEEEEAEATDTVHKAGHVEMRGQEDEGGGSSSSSWQRDLVCPGHSCSLLTFHWHFLWFLKCTPRLTSHDSTGWVCSLSLHNLSASFRPRMPPSLEDFLFSMLAYSRYRSPRG